MRSAVLVIAAVVTIVPAFPADLPGKAVFDQSCKNCHGEAGKGDNIADRFFKVRIPRLTSQQVQSRTDAQLKEIILRGSGRMQPVRIGSPSIPHGKTKDLTNQQVDDVIAYVRTLAKNK